MTKQVINVGTVANDKTGDTIRAAFTKANENFTELYNTKNSLSNVALSGSYADLIAKPTVPTALSQLTNDSHFITSSQLTWSNISSKPTIPSFTSQLTNDSQFVNASQLTWNSIQNRPTIPTDVNQLTDTNGLLNGQGGGTTVASRTTHSITSSFLADQGSEFLNVPAFKGYIVLKIETSVAAWVRLYTDSQSRINDNGRSISQDPSNDSGVVTEVITSGQQTVVIAPGAFGFNNEINPIDFIPITVTNLSGSTTDITVTLTLIQTEL